VTSGSCRKQHGNLFDCNGPGVSLIFIFLSSRLFGLRNLAVGSADVASPPALGGGVGASGLVAGVLDAGLGGELVLQAVEVDVGRAGRGGEHLNCAAAVLPRDGAVLTAAEVSAAAG